MCRSIKVLRKPDAAGQTATSEEVQSAALQYVRKVSGFHKPSQLHQKSFDQAVVEVAAATQRLLGAINTRTRRAS